MRRLTAVLAMLLMLLALAPGAQAAAPEQKIRVVVGTTELDFDTPPLIEEGRTLVPLRTLAESLGFAVAYDPAERRITLTKDGSVLELWVGSSKAKVNGKDFALEAAPKIAGNRTLVPVRFIAEQLGAHVTWNQADRLVYVRRGEEFARHLYERSQDAAKAGVIPDMVAKGKMLIAVKAAGPGPAGNVNIEMPIGLEMHTYKSDMLMTVTMTQPTAQGPQTLTTQQAVVGGKHYMLLPGAPQWMLVGEANVAEIIAQGSGMSLADTIRAEKDLLQGAKFSFGGLETSGGVTTGRVDLQISSSAMGALTDQIMGQLGALAPQGGELKIAFDRTRMSFWVDLVSGKIQRYTMEMGMVMSGSQQGVALNLKMLLLADVSYQYVSEPIQFPDLSGAVTP